jgi:hypothetical protein
VTKNDTPHGSTAANLMLRWIALYEYAHQQSGQRYRNCTQRDRKKRESPIILIQLASLYSYNLPRYFYDMHSGVEHSFMSVLKRG